MNKEAMELLDKLDEVQLKATVETLQAYSSGATFENAVEAGNKVLVANRRKPVRMDNPA